MEIRMNAEQIDDLIFYIGEGQNILNRADRLDKKKNEEFDNLCIRLRDLWWERLDDLEHDLSYQAIITISDDEKILISMALNLFQNALCNLENDEELLSEKHNRETAYTGIMDFQSFLSQMADSIVNK